tara:strand:- start:73 stop:282 length:210 start_codon:yes stop_codon:yes gene_type:complete
MKHLEENNETYLSHLKFAWTAAFHMIISSCFFLVHGLVPLIPIPKLFNLGRMSQRMRKWDTYTQIRKLR